MFSLIKKLQPKKIKKLKHKRSSEVYNSVQRNIDVTFSEGKVENSVSKTEDDITQGSKDYACETRYLSVNRLHEDSLIDNSFDGFKASVESINGDESDTGGWEVISKAEAKIDGYHDLSARKSNPFINFIMGKFKPHQNPLSSHNEEDLLQGWEIVGKGDGGASNSELGDGNNIQFMLSNSEREMLDDESDTRNFTGVLMLKDDNELKAKHPSFQEHSSDCISVNVFIKLDCKSKISTTVKELLNNIKCHKIVIYVKEEFSVNNSECFVNIGGMKSGYNDGDLSVDLFNPKYSVPCIDRMQYYVEHFCIFKFSSHPNAIYGVDLCHLMLMFMIIEDSIKKNFLKSYENNIVLYDGYGKSLSSFVQWVVVLFDGIYSSLEDSCKEFVTKSQLVDHLKSIDTGFSSKLALFESSNDELVEFKKEDIFKKLTGCILSTDFSPELKVQLLYNVVNSYICNIAINKNDAYIFSGNDFWGIIIDSQLDLLFIKPHSKECIFHSMLIGIQDFLKKKDEKDSLKQNLSYIFAIFDSIKDICDVFKHLNQLQLLFKKMKNVKSESGFTALHFFEEIEKNISVYCSVNKKVTLQFEGEVTSQFKEEVVIQFEEEVELFQLKEEVKLQYDKLYKHIMKLEREKSTFVVNVDVHEVNGSSYSKLSSQILFT